MSRLRIISASAALLLVAACAPTLESPPLRRALTVRPRPQCSGQGDFSWSAVPSPGRLEAAWSTRRARPATRCAGRRGPDPGNPRGPGGG